ncbi:MAG: hypothetical protein JWN04_2570 [Myxococcaceae bacterium]|nr:hypothetical protein [Myxococcaceae bacterium]
MRFDDVSGDAKDTPSNGVPPISPTSPNFGRQVRASATLAWRTISAADGTTVMLHQQSQDDEVVISQAGGYGGGFGNCQPITQGGVTRYDAAGKPSSPILLGGAALVVDIAASSDGRWLALAKPGAYLRGESASLEVISTALSSAGGNGDAGVAIPASTTLDGGVPSLPPGVFVTADGGLQFTGPSFISPSQCNTGWTEGFDVQTTAVAFDLEGNLYAFSREPAQLTIYRVGVSGSELDIFPSLELDQTIALNSVSMRDTGHELFHGDVGTGLACASCHGEALDDGHVWNFRDFGPRRTQNIRGGLLGTLPLHWEGDLSSFQALIDEVMTRRMGGFQVEPKYGTALANWIDKQPAVSVKTSDTAAAASGKLLFESPTLLCTSCHSGSTLTNNQTVDVGTGGAFQVPSLRGLGLHAPYMHDGCAVTLADRFDPACGGGDSHGKTSQLSDAQIRDLVAYLQTL